eukprot:4467640-Prymnesium_polylepis.2
MLNPPERVKDQLQLYATRYGGSSTDDLVGGHSSNASVVSGDDLDLTDEAEEAERMMDGSWVDWGTAPVIDVDAFKQEYAANPTALALPELQEDMFVRSREAVRTNTFDTFDTWDEFNPRGEEDAKAKA